MGANLTKFQLGEMTNEQVADRILELHRNNENNGVNLMPYAECVRRNAHLMNGEFFTNLKNAQDLLHKIQRVYMTPYDSEGWDASTEVILDHWRCSMQQKAVKVPTGKKVAEPASILVNPSDRASSSDSENLKLKKELKKLRAEKRNLEAKCATLSEQAGQAKHYIKEYKKSKKQVRQLECDTEQLQDEADILTLQKRQELTKRIGMEKELQSSRTELDRLQQANQEYSTDFETLQAENKRLQAGYATCKRKLQQTTCTTTSNLELRQVVESPQEVSKAIRLKRRSAAPIAHVPPSRRPSKRRKTRNCSRASHDANNHDLWDDEWVASSDKSESDDESSETNRVLKRSIPKQKCSNTSRVMKRTIPKRKRSNGAKKSSSRSKQQWYSFKERVEQLQIYKKANGDCNVPRKHPELGNWVHNVRMGQNKLSDNQRKILDEMGFCWSAQKSFDQRVEQLQDFFNIHGHCNVPRSDPELGHWVHNVRKGHITLSANQRKILDEMGFCWSLRLSFDQRLNQLQDFINIHGHCIVPQSVPSLGQWVGHVRSGHITLSDEQRKILDRMKFQWSVRPRRRSQQSSKQKL